MSVKKTVWGEGDDGQSHALSNWQFPIALSKSGLKKSIRLVLKNDVLRSRLDEFEVSLGARTRHRRSPFKFLVCAILTENLLQQQRRRQPEGRTSFHKQQIAPLSVSNQLLVFYFATVSFFFFVCV